MRRGHSFWDHIYFAVTGLSLLTQILLFPIVMMVAILDEPIREAGRPRKYR